MSKTKLYKYWNCFWLFLLYGFILSLFYLVITMNDIFAKEGKFIIFKDSPTCPISAKAREEVAQYKGDLEIITVDVLSEKELKMEIAEKYGVEHESPQILVIDGQKCIADFSHYDITAEKLNALR